MPDLIPDVNCDVPDLAPDGNRDVMDLVPDINHAGPRPGSQPCRISSRTSIVTCRTSPRMAIVMDRGQVTEPVNQIQPVNRTSSDLLQTQCSSITTLSLRGSVRMYLLHWILHRILYHFGSLTSLGSLLHLFTLHSIGSLHWILLLSPPPLPHHLVHHFSPFRLVFICYRFLM